ncbi:cadmium resistance transporter [Hutsoniella sourekii]|uniref:cadmium resistance transporter n=1 Tax=Hutsoniella sourekii TaxID=87650 RepID=UPI0004868BEC|nr:cadmium resistance transporter [Hutsoniella sourekii]
MELLLSAILVFASTSIDYLLVIMILFTVVGERRANAVFGGQLLGIGVLVVASLIAAYFLKAFPQEWMIGLLGLVPLFLGIRSLYVDEDVEEEEVRQQVSGPSGLVMQVAALSIALGGDNLGIYIPYFTGLTPAQILGVVFIFALATYGLCWFAKRIAGLPMIEETIEKYERLIVPVVFIGLGLYILWEHQTLSGLLSWLA